MKRYWFMTLSFLFVFCITSIAYAGTLLSYPKFFTTDSSTGLPLVGGKLYTYIAGSTTSAKATYSDRACTTPNTNPIVLNARGEATVYMTGVYNLILKDSDDATIWSMDNVEGTPAGSYTFYPNPTEADHGATSTGGSLKDILTALGTSTKATVILLHSGAAAKTSYAVNTTYNASTYTNVAFDFENGAVLAVATGITLTLPSPAHIKAGQDQQIFSLTGTGNVRFGKSGDHHVGWWGALGDDPGDGTGTNDAAALLAAIACARATYYTSEEIGATLCGIPGRIYLSQSELFVGRNATTSGRWVYRIKDLAIYGKHTGYILDYTGAHGKYLENVVLIGDSVTIPKGGLFLARKDTTSGGRTFINRLRILGSYSVGGFISYASEELYLNNSQIAVTDGIYSAIFTDTGYYWDGASWTALTQTNQDSDPGVCSNMNHVITNTRFEHHGTAGAEYEAHVHLSGTQRLTLDGCFFGTNSAVGDAVSVFVRTLTHTAATGEAHNGYLAIKNTTFHSAHKRTIEVYDSLLSPRIENCKWGTPALLTGSNFHAGEASVNVVNAYIEAESIDFSAATCDFIGNNYLKIGSEASPSVGSINISQSFQGTIECRSTVTVTLGGTTTVVKGMIKVADTGITYPFYRHLQNLERVTTLGAGNITLTAAALVGGYIFEDPEGAATWTTDTAANIVAAIPHARNGTAFTCYLVNDATNGSLEVVTIAGGVGVTLRGEQKTMTEGKNNTAMITFIVTNILTPAIDAVIITGEIDTDT